MRQLKTPIRPSILYKLSLDIKQWIVSSICISIQLWITNNSLYIGRNKTFANTETCLEMGNGNMIGYNLNWWCIQPQATASKATLYEQGSTILDDGVNTIECLKRLLTLICSRLLDYIQGVKKVRAIFKQVIILNDVYWKTIKHCPIHVGINHAASKLS